MKLLKTELSNGGEAIVNLDRVIHFTKMSENKTYICFEGPDNYLIVNIRLEDLQKELLAFDGTHLVIFNQNETHK